MFIGNLYGKCGREKWEYLDAQWQGEGKMNVTICAHNHSTLINHNRFVGDAIKIDV